MAYENGAEPDQTAEFALEYMRGKLMEQSDQGLHCLPFHKLFLRNNSIKKIGQKVCNKVFEILGDLP